MPNHIATQLFSHGPVPAIRIARLVAGPLAVMGLLLTTAAALAAQSAQARVQASPSSGEINSTVTVTLKIDVSQVPPPNNNLAAYDGYFRWNPSILQYQSKVEPSWGTPQTNTANASSGYVRFANTSSVPQTGNVTILTLTFRAIASGTSPLDIDVQSASSGTLSEIPVQNNDVTFTVVPPPAIGVSPSSLSFSGTAGSSNPATQPFQISNTGGGTLTWTASAGAGWLSVSPISGTNTGTVTVSVNTAGMPAGTYTSAVTVTAPGASPASVSVTLTLSQPPAIGVSPSSLSFSGTEGGANPATQTFQISNTGGGTLSWTASPSVAWLSVSPSSGTNSGTVTVSVNTAGMPAGSYTSNVSVTAPGASPASVGVTLSLSQRPVIAVSPSSLAFSGTAAGSNPASQSLQISNGGGGTLSWSIASGAAWLSVSPASGTDSGTAVVSVNSAGMAAGTYGTALTVSGSGADPVTVPVTLTLSSGSGIGLSTSLLVFSGTSGGPALPAQKFQVSNTGGGTLSWSVASGARWAVATPSSGTNTGTVNVSVNVGTRPPGTYTTTLTVSAPGAASRTVIVKLILTHLLAFDRKPVGGNYDINLYDVATSTTISLPGLNRADANDRRASLSYDANLIAFFSTRDGGSDIYMYDRVAASMIPLPGLNTAAYVEDSPSLSGMGDLIAFSSDRNGGSDVLLYNRTTSALVALPNLNTPLTLDRHPSLSRNGRFIAFQSDRSGAGDIFLYDRTTSSLLPLPGLNSAAIEASPALANGGRLIAFASDREGAGDIFLYDRQTESLVSLPGVNTPNFVERWPSLSSDGRFLAFSSNRNGNDEVYLYDRKTSSLVSLPGVNTPGNEGLPSAR